MIFNLNVENYVYHCNGVNDNVNISNLVKTFLQGGSDYRFMKLSVIGDIGLNAPVSGSGTSSSPYFWFDFHVESNRNAIIDFSNAGAITPTITNGTYNVIFYSNTDIHITDVNVIANNTTTDTIIRVLYGELGSAYFENCRFWITGYKDCLIAQKGSFINCRGSIANVNSNTYCFLPATAALVRLYGGEYYAYTGGSALQSAVIGQSAANATSILYGVNAPTVSRSGFYQTNSLIQYTGGGYMNCTDLVSALPLVVTSGISNIRGTIPFSKPNTM